MNYWVIFIVFVIEFQNQVGNEVACNMIRSEHFDADKLPRHVTSLSRDQADI